MQISWLFYNMLVFFITDCTSVVLNGCPQPFVRDLLDEGQIILIVIAVLIIIIFISGTAAILYLDKYRRCVRFRRRGRQLIHANDDND